VAPNPREHEKTDELHLFATKHKSGNQAQIMALLRGLSFDLIRKFTPQNFKALIDMFSDSVSILESLLRQVKFLRESRVGTPTSLYAMLRLVLQKRSIITIRLIAQFCTNPYP